MKTVRKTIIEKFASAMKKAFQPKQSKGGEVIYMFCRIKGKEKFLIPAMKKQTLI